MLYAKKFGATISCERRVMSLQKFSQSMSQAKRIAHMKSNTRKGKLSKQATLLSFQIKKLGGNGITAAKLDKYTTKELTGLISELSKKLRELVGKVVKK